MQEPEAEVEVRGLVGRKGLVVTTSDGRGRLVTSTLLTATPRPPTSATPRGAPGKSPSPPPRQVSADSGIEGEGGALLTPPPRLTSYCESESFLTSQPGCATFAPHLHRILGPLATELRQELAQSGEEEWGAGGR